MEAERTQYRLAEIASEGLDGILGRRISSPGEKSRSGLTGLGGTSGQKKQVINMQRKVEAYIRRHNMLERGSRVIAAVSGGADSVCLLHLLVSIGRQLELDIQAVHVHHGLRGQEADRDAQFVRELSEKWKVPCLVVCRDAAAYAKRQGLSIEEAGREIRYQAFMEAAGQSDKARIAVAHHQEDQAETILHNLFRGSGLKGAGGMAPVRGNIIRPLLCAGRKEIEAYLQERGIPYCQDSTNASTEYTRNKLRHKVIPLISEEVNSQAVAHIVAAGEKMRQAEAYFECESARLWQEYGRTDIRDGGYRRVGIAAKTVAGLPDILQGYVVMEMISKLCGLRKDISSSHVQQVLDLAEKGTGRYFDLPYGVRACREYDTVWLEMGERTDIRPSGTLLNNGSFSMECIPASVFREKYRKIPEKTYTKWFDYDKIKGTLSVRTRQTGDYFTLKDGKKKTIKAFMIDEKIPRAKRDEMLLLAEGHHVLWIVGCRISEFYKVTEETKQILQVKADGGEEHER